MKAYVGVGVYIHIFIDLGTSLRPVSASRSCSFTPEERAPGTHWIGGWVGPRFGLDPAEKR
jgi:hypothetical protein